MPDNDDIPHRIIAIDDEPFFLELISLSLNAGDVKCLSNGNTLDEDVINCDLLILDINLEEETGYELCQKAREINSDIPILFMSSMKDLDARLKAYGSGGSDYISKPFASEELTHKANILISNYRRTLKLKDELHNRSLLVHDIQRASSHMQVINQFSLLGSQCKDFNTLLLVFFNTLEKLGLQGVVAIHGIEPKSSTQDMSRLEKEILSLGDQLPRIHSFGKQRALYNWSNCRLLVRDIGPHIDTAAILMDALEIAIDRIKHEDRLFEQILLMETHCDEVKNKLAEIIETMKDQISNELLNLGIVSSLSWDDEERINGILEKYTRSFEMLFVEQEIHNCNLRDAIESLRAPHPNLSKQLDSSSNNQDDDLF